MALCLHFSKTSAPSPQLQYPEGVEYTKDGSPVDSNGFPCVPTEVIPRPFVPSVAPEDVEKAIEIGVITPRSVTAADKDAVPFVRRTPTWADKARNMDPEKDHYDAHQNLLDDIEFLQMQELNENDEMLDEASEWLESQENILWAPISGYPSFMTDNFAIMQAEYIPESTTQEIKIVRVEPLWSLGSINGKTDIYIPWGSETSYEGKASKWVPLLYRKPLRLHEFICVDMVYHPQGRNFWKVTKVYPKLSTSDMLTSCVISVTEYNEFKPVERVGSQYNYNIPCAPENIGNIIGQNGKNINGLINKIQKEREQKWYGPMPKHIDPDYPEFPLPEVTITPIEAPDSYSGPSSHKPTRAYVRVYCPTCCIWDKKEVEELVSYMHS